MISKSILIQYSNLQEEVKEIREKIEKLERMIQQDKKRMGEIEAGEVVKDKVYGGPGGNQGYVIEGVPVKEYERRRTDLLSKRFLIEKQMAILEDREHNLLEKTNEIEIFLSTVKDSRMRRIINLRFVEGLSWNKVADRIGGGNTEDSVRMSFNRFMENKK